MPYLDKEKLYRAVADYIEENFICDILEHEKHIVDIAVDVLLADAAYADNGCF